MFKAFVGVGYYSGGMKAFYVGVSSKVLTSLSSLSSEVVLHRYLVLYASF